MAALPYVDEHSRPVHASPDRVWSSLSRFVEGMLRPAPRAFARLWKLEQPSAFTLAEETAPTHLALSGRHRFSSYSLVFDVTATPGGAALRARTFAEFHGARGRMYRAMVIGTGGHAIVVRNMLARVARSAERLVDRA